MADRGLLSLDNLEALRGIVLANGQALEFILAVPGRRCSEFVALLEDFHGQHCIGAQEEVVGELPWSGLRLVIAHDPAAAAIQTQRRHDQIDRLVAQADAWAGKLDGQEAGGIYRGRKLSDSGVQARFFSAVRDAQLSKIIKVDLPGDPFSFEIDEGARGLAEMMDGKLLLVTNAADLGACQVIERYKSLADIERGFKVLKSAKSAIAIGPVHHRPPERVRAHAAICFIALILHRVLRARLRQAGSGLSPQRVLEQLRRIQPHQVRLNGGAPITGVSTVTPEQGGALNAIGVKNPSHRSN